MAKKTKKKAVSKKVVGKGKKATRKVSGTDAIVVGLVNLVNKHVTAKEPALHVVKLIFYACGRLILEQEGSQSLHEQIKYIIED